MNNIKSLKEISWQVTEEEYREHSALSYSTLAKYERGGFNSLDTLFDKVESPSLTFGSAVDSIITGGMQEFNERFIVADFPEISSTIITLITAIFNDYKDTYINLIDIPENIIIDYTNNYKYQLNWKPETRVKVLKEKGSEYYIEKRKGRVFEVAPFKKRKFTYGVGLIYDVCLFLPNVCMNLSFILTSFLQIQRSYKKNETCKFGCRFLFISVYLY